MEPGKTAKKKAEKAAKYAQLCWKSTCVLVSNKKHLKRDIIILSSLIIILGAFFLSSKTDLSKKFQRNNALWTEVPSQEDQTAETEQESVEIEEKKVADIVSEIDTSAWTPYQSTWYGITLKYPNNWKDPVARKAMAGVLWEQQLQFRMEQSDDSDPFEGFDVVVYNVGIVKEASNTEEFPKLKSAELKSDEACAMIEGHLLENVNFPAEEIYIPANDACYNSALFFTNTRDNYIYNLVPKVKDGMGLAGDPAKEIESHMPEFFAVASTLEFIDIVRPKPVPLAPAKPKITAPMPYIFKKDSQGRRVCSTKNDKPAKSNKGKGKHMDMECCLDPDEYPNPHCYYDPGKYGKYL